MKNIHFVIGHGENCCCFDCPVLYGGECYTTKINNALDKFDKSVEGLIVKNKNLSSYQLYKILKPIFKDIKEYSSKLKVKDIDRFYKVFRTLMLITNSKDFVDEFSYRRMRYDLFRMLLLDIENYIAQHPDYEDNNYED